MREFFVICRNRTVVAVFCVIGVVLFALFGCEGLTENLTVPKKPFFVEAFGEVDGETVEIKVFCDPTTHSTKEIYNKLTVTFFAPTNFDGITVSLRSDGKATVRLSNIEEEMPYYEGLAEPYLVFLPSGEASSVKKVDMGTEVVYGDGEERLAYFFDADGQLKRIEGCFEGHKILLNITKICENGK